MSSISVTNGGQALVTDKITVLDDHVAPWPVTISYFGRLSMRRPSGWRSMAVLN